MNSEDSTVNGTGEHIDENILWHTLPEGPYEFTIKDARFAVSVTRAPMINIDFEVDRSISNDLANHCIVHTENFTFTQKGAFKFKALYPALPSALNIELPKVISRQILSDLAKKLIGIRVGGNIVNREHDKDGREGMVDLKSFFSISQNKMDESSLSLPSDDEENKYLAEIADSEHAISEEIIQDQKIDSRWVNGTLILVDGTGNKAIPMPLTKLFHKLESIRDNLRLAGNATTDAKVKMYLEKCAGSLTNFNTLFANEEDEFKGTTKK